MGASIGPDTLAAFQCLLGVIFPLQPRALPWAEEGRGPFGPQAELALERESPLERPSSGPSVLTQIRDRLTMS